MPELLSLLSVSYWGDFPFTYSVVDKSKGKSLQSKGMPSYTTVTGKSVLIGRSLLYFCSGDI